MPEHVHEVRGAGRRSSGGAAEHPHVRRRVGRRGDVSEWIYQCKHSNELQALPWIFLALFAGVVFCQLA